MKSRAQNWPQCCLFEPQGYIISCHIEEHSLDEGLEDSHDIGEERKMTGQTAKLIETGGMNPAFQCGGNFERNGATFPGVRSTPVPAFSCR